MNKANNLTGLELVNKLNNERTQGIWGTNFFADGLCIFADKFGRISTTKHNHENKSEHETNANFTVLACNNFAKVCEALQYVLETTPDKQTYDKIKQVLNNIKL